MVSQEFPGAGLAEPALAKINLSLRVLGRRADGYHLIESLVCFADLGERLTARIADEVDLKVSGPMATDLGAGGNLVLAADSAFRQSFAQTPPLAYALDKHIPVAAGLGGGSADAAAALRLLAGLVGIPADDPEVARMALDIGADVPVCLGSRPAWVSGIGERLRPAQALPELSLVLVNPRIAVATGEVFGALAISPGEKTVSEGKSAIDTGGIEQLVIEARNDLEDAARRLVPDIAGVIDAIATQPGCRAARMSGSGATCFGVFAEGAAAEQAAGTIAATRPDWWVKAARSGALMPAASV